MERVLRFDAVLRAVKSAPHKSGWKQTGFNYIQQKGGVATIRPRPFILGEREKIGCGWLRLMYYAENIRQQAYSLKARAKAKDEATRALINFRVDEKGGEYASGQS